MTGQSWSNVVKYFPDLIQKIMIKGAVFARMSGAQKAQVIEHLKQLGYYVGELVSFMLVRLFNNYFQLCAVMELTIVGL